MMKKQKKQKKNKPINWNKIAKLPEFVELKKKLAKEGWVLLAK